MTRPPEPAALKRAREPGSSWRSPADGGEASGRSIQRLVYAGYQRGPTRSGYCVVRVRAGVPIGTGATRLLRRLLPDMQSGPVITMGIRWRAQRGLSHAAIGRRLAANPDDYLPPAGPVTGTVRIWTARSVSNRLSDLVCADRQVWGWTRAGQPSPCRNWIVSHQPAHEPLVGLATSCQLSPVTVVSAKGFITHRVRCFAVLRRWAA